jgi:hypothetical protein
MEHLFVLLNDINYYNHLASLTDNLMSMKHQWNDTDKGKLKHSVKKAVEVSLVHQKSQMDWPRIEQGLLHRVVSS